MRGGAERQANMLLAVTPDSFIPEEHPISSPRSTRSAASNRSSNRRWRGSPPCSTACTRTAAGPSIPPEHLLKASLLIALSSIRSERQFCERLRYDFAWGGKTSCGPPILMMQTS